MAGKISPSGSVDDGGLAHQQAIVLAAELDRCWHFADIARAGENDALARSENGLEANRRTGAVALAEGCNDVEAVWLDSIISVTGDAAEIDGLALDRLKTLGHGGCGEGQDGRSRQENAMM